MKKRRSLVALAVAFTLVCGLASKPASAVDKFTVANGATTADEKAAHRSANVTASGLEIGNQYVTAKVASDGKFSFGLAPAGDNRFYNISYAWPEDPWSSMTTVRVDGSNNVLGMGGLTQAPTNTTNLSNEAGWRFGDIEVRQTLSIIPAPVDTTQIRYTVTNKGTASHNVGLRMLIDTMISNNDGAPYRIPSPSGDLDTVTTEREYAGADVPAYWRAFNSLDDPDVTAQWTLRGDGVTPPDRMATARWNSRFVRQGERSRPYHGLHQRARVQCLRPSGERGVW